MMKMLLLISSSTRARGFAKIGARSPAIGVGCRHCHRPSTGPALAATGRRSPSHRGLSTPWDTAPPTRSASSLAGSLRDLLDRAAPPGASPPAAAAPASASATLSTATSAATSRTITIGGRAITTAPTRPAPTPATGAPYAQPLVSISDAYDSGNGELASLRLADGAAEDGVDVHVGVRIRPDPYTALEDARHSQHFSFRATLNPDAPEMRGRFRGRTRIRARYALENAGAASYADAFAGYAAFATTGRTPFDPAAWGRKGDTAYDGKRLTWTHDHEVGEPSAYFAYFPPYSQERHLALVEKCAAAEGVTVASLGQTLDGRELDVVTVGTGSRTCWVIHRQHPGESMAEFYAEGLLTRLLGLDDKWDKVAEKARELYTFHIVSNINPDGSCRGYLRTNAAGQNLNREWCPSPAPAADDGAEGAAADPYAAPTLARSPEVHHLLQRMDATGCDAFLDVHGDEELPFNFLAGSEGTSVWSPRLEGLHGAFLAAYARANGDMQAAVSYEPDAPGAGMSHVCSNQIAERFDCFAATLEMPFKELWGDATTAGEGVPQTGWGPARATQLGASVLDALCYISPYLREEGKFWEGLPEEDAYVRPTSKY